MYDRVPFLISVIPTLFSAIIAAMRSADLDRYCFVDPALIPVEEITGISTKCKTCIDHVIRPSIEISVSRSQTAYSLSFLSLGLMSQVPFLMFSAENSTAAISFLLYFFAPFLLSVYYVLGRRDAFAWWRNAWTRFALIAWVGSVPLIGGQDLTLVDIVGLVAYPNRLSAIWGYHPLLLPIIVMLAAFLLARVWVNRSRPSLRRQILMALDDAPGGLGVDGLTIRLNQGIPQVSARVRREHVQRQLDELAYQRRVHIRFSDDETSIIYSRL